MQKADFGRIHSLPFSWAIRACSKFLSVCLVLGIVQVNFGEAPLRNWTVSELVRGAELVVLGRVVSKTVANLEATGIQTTLSLDLEDVWKGSLQATNSVSFYVPGGVLGERKVVVTGQPEFALDETCLVFLKQAEDRRWVLVGFGQGKLGVESDRTNRDCWILTSPRVGIEEFKRRVMEINAERQ